MSPEYTTENALVPDATALTTHVADPLVIALAAHPLIDVPPSSKFMVPVAFVPAVAVTLAVSVTDVPAFWGDAGEALSVVMEAADPSVTVAGEELAAA